MSEAVSGGTSNTRERNNAANVRGSRPRPAWCFESRSLAFSQTWFNIQSLTVGHTERLGISRMTIGVDMGGEISGNIEANLYKLQDVTLVERISNAVAIAYELALIKIPSLQTLESFCRRS